MQEPHVQTDECQRKAVLVFERKIDEEEKEQ
jgi:hypothetical protein